MTTPLLAVDGDSFAHRAFHALPKTFRRDDGGPANTLIGLHVDAAAALAGRAPAGGRRRLGHALRPDLPQRAARGLPVGPRVRSRDRRAARPAAGARLRDRHRLRQGRRASRPTTFSRLRSPVSGRAAAPRSWRPPTATRSSSRLPTSRSSSRCAASASWRASALLRCGSVTASSRSRCATSSRCAAIRPTRFPARGGSGEKTAASLLQTYPIWRRCSLPGASRPRPRSSAAYRQIATLDPTAPLPDVPDLEPDWAAGARAAEELGVERLASRLREAGEREPIEPVSHPAMAHLHPTGHHHHPESEHRLRCLTRRAPAGDRGRTRRPSRRSSASTTRTTSTRIAALAEECWLDGDTIGQPTTWEAARLAAGLLRSAPSRSVGSRSCARRGTTRSATARWASASSATSPSRRGTRRQELGIERVAIVDWDVHHGNGTEALVRGDDSVLFVSLHEWPFYPGTGGPGTSDETILNIPLASRVGRRRLRRGVSTSSSSRPCVVRARGC